MSDREPMPILGPSTSMADQQSNADQFVADPSADSSNASLRRTDSRSSAASIDAPAQRAPRRDWDRLTYGGVGGWFKRLFSSRKRAQHRREVQERRDAWSQLQAGISDQDYSPDLSLLRSNWGSRKLQRLDADTDRDISILQHMGQSPRQGASEQKAAVARMKFFQRHGVDDAQIDPGPSEARPQPQRGILKQPGPRPVKGPVEPDASMDNAIGAMNQALSTTDSDYDEEHNAWEALRALPKTASKPQKEQAQARYQAAQDAQAQQDYTRKELATAATSRDQADLAFPIRDVNPGLTKSKRKVIAFHQGYWNREQQAPAPTSKASHDRKVRFNMGDSSTEHLLNTPGNMPDAGEVTSLTEEGAPADGRILPTGAFQYQAADPEKMYAGTSAGFRTAFNRTMAQNPDYLEEHLRPASQSEFAPWAAKLSAVRNRPSMSATSRKKGPLDPALAGPAEAKGAEFHRARHGGMIAPDNEEMP